MDSPRQFHSGNRRVYFNLQRVAQRLKVAADEQFRVAGGITTSQAAALAIVVRNPGCAQRLLADELGQRESAITTMAARLETAGLVERRPSAADSRAWELWPTTAGREAMTGLHQALAVINELLEEAVGPDNVDDFADALDRLSQALDSRA
ncbi:MarR family winged helix-turn-helix transcriptional regulator [Nocardia sp. NPDC052001]|uniref:MarR family winged helix-turn-helix transcriptional regulator n=1 Tax=Nocardia sp. NPDC052001 TaxID=3154853 RepID=UPI003425746A